MQVAVTWCQNYLISLSLSSDLNFLDLNNPSQPKQIVQGHQVNILSLATELTQSRILTGSYDGVVRSWTSHLAETLPGAHHTAKITGISAISNQIVSSDWEDQLHFANENEYIAAERTAERSSAYGVGLAVASTNKGVKLLREPEASLQDGQVFVDAHVCGHLAV
ncbi:unnamed protein product [Peronospora destructor]|uniref:Uncharacterized protein n=1 Tax=Peronospora destructor TaxID=86335 RepID=A0AAV0UWQ4_9STRA|nr:unnamed protein product [Peronospora destructor]